MTEPHQLRCETCGHNPSNEGLDFDSCPLWSVLNEKYSDESKDYKIRLLGSFVVTTGYTGCASHSAATSAEKVLEEYSHFIQVKLNDLKGQVDKKISEVSFISESMQGYPRIVYRCDAVDAAQKAINDLKDDLRERERS